MPWLVFDKMTYSNSDVVLHVFQNIQKNKQKRQKKKSTADRNLPQEAQHAHTSGIYHPVRGTAEDKQVWTYGVYSCHGLL